MVSYRVYFFNELSHIKGTESVDGISDDEAIVKAHALLHTRSDCCNFDLWDETRPVRIAPRTKHGQLLGLTG